MDTNNKQFQDALQNLTNAFFQFLDVVNPGSADQEAKIRFIAQSLQALTSNLKELSSSPDVGSNMTMSTSTQMTTASTVQEIQPTSTQASHFPLAPNWCREQPSKIEEGVWGFKRLNEYEEGSDFRFYIEGEDGLFDMRTISDAADWTRIYNSRNEIMPSGVVIIEGEMSPSARLETLEKGVVHSEGVRMRQYWHVVKPCRVKVTPV